MRIEIYDTTLRDGTQGEQIAFSAAEKLRAAELLDELGVDYIEGGWPGANPRDSEFFARARGLRLQHARLAAFGSTAHPNSAPENDANLRALLDAETEVVTIFGKSWTLHVEHALGISRDANLRLVEASVRLLAAAGREVIFDAEHFFDGYRADADYALAVLAAAQAGGAQCFVLCDTNGGSLPGFVAAATTAAAARLPGARLGIHTHNDCDLGAANALAAIAAGARHVQGTFNGWGERCGNASLCSLLPLLELKLDCETIGRERLARLEPVARQLAELAGVPLHHRLPFVGASAFAHKGGIHVSAVRRLPESYEHIPPETVGNHRRILVSDLAGRSNIHEKARELGIALSAPQAAAVTEAIKRREHAGYELEGADGTLALLMARHAENEPPPFEPLGFEIVSRYAEPEPNSNPAPDAAQPGFAVDAGPGGASEARVRLRVAGETVAAAAADTGPVAALDRALRAALAARYPQLRDVVLSDYKVRILEGSRGTRARVRVRVESTDGQRSWVTVGVSDNILEASWEALLASFACHLRPKD